MRLPFTPGRVAWMAAPMSLLILVSYLLNPQAWLEAAGWVYASLGLFFFAVLVFPLLLVRRCWLELNRDGIHVRLLLRHETWRWQDIAGFVTATLDHGPAPMVRMVGINFRNAPPRLPAWLAPVMQRMNGYHRSLPAWFGGLNAPELADLLERSRREYTPD
jgi:hypothetical protein